MHDAVKYALRLAKTTKRRQKLGDGGTPYGAALIGEDKIILGSPHGEPIELSDDLKSKVQDIAKKHGAYYEGNAGDVEANKALIPEYKGSWDAAHGSGVKGYPVEYLAPMFSNVEINKPYETYADPEKTIMASIIANQDKAKYFSDRKFDEKVLRDFLTQGSEKDVNLLKMAQQKATPENLKQFFSKGESLMWPENWQEYPHNLGKIVKRFEDARNQYLLEAPPGVYVAGAGHIPELKRLKKDLNVVGGERAGYATAGSVEGDVQFAPDDVKFEDKDKVAPPPMMAQNEYSMHLPQQEVKYDTGPQPGEQTLKAYEPTTREQIAQTMMGDQAPSPERRHFVEGMMGTTGLGHQGMGVADFVPVAGQALQAQEAYQHKDPKEFLLATVPVPGANIESKLAQAGRTAIETAAPVVQHAAEQAVEAIAPQLTKKQSQAAMDQRWAEGNGDPKYKNAQHQWNVEEGPKYRAAQTPAVESGPVVQKKPTGFQLPDPYERVTNPAGFYSHGAEAARALPQQKGTLEQMISALKGYGVRPEEIRWSNIEQAFAGRPSVTGEELAQHFESALPRVNRITKEPFDYNDYDAWDTARDRAWDHIREDYSNDMERMIDDWKEQNPGEWESMDEAQRERLQENLDTEWYENNDEYANELADLFFREEADERGPKWGADDYNFPGGEDYFENILTIPNVKGDANYFHPQVYDDATRATRDQLESDYHKLSLDHNVAEMEIRNAIDAEQYRLSRKSAENAFKDLERYGYTFSTPEERQAAFKAWEAADKEVETAREAYKAGANSIIPDEELDALRAKRDAALDVRDAAQKELAKIDKNTREGMFDDLYDQARRKFQRSPKSLFEELGLWDEYEALSNPPGYAELAEKHQNARQKLNDFNADLIQRSQELWAKDPHNYERELYRNTTHWPGIDNPILHNRFKTYRQNGKKILNKSEAQSDWAKEDFNAALNPSEENELTNLFSKQTRTPEENLRATHLLSKQNLSGKTKEVPYVGNTERWAELSAKDALTHALENDFDQIALTSGAEQAKRNSRGIRQAASNISWETYPDYIGPVPDVLAEPYAHAMFGKTWKELTYQEKNDAKATALEVARDAAPNLFPGNIHAVPRGAKKVSIKLSDGRDAELMVSPVKQPNGNIKNIVVKSPGFSEAEGKVLGSVIGSDLEKQVMGAESGDKKLNNYMMGSGGYDQIYEQALPKAYTKLFKALGFQPNIYKGKLKTPRARREGLTLDEIRNIAFNMTPEQEAKFGDQMKNLIDVVERSDDQGYASSRFFERSSDYDFTRFMHPFKSEADRDVIYIDIPPEMREKYEELKRDYGAVFPAYKRGGAVDTSHLAQITDRGLKAARRAAFADGGKTMIKRKAYEPVRGLKITPPAEELSKEPDIRAYQMARHAHEFIGSPEPVAPRRPVVLDAPLFGGKHELFSAPYTYHPTIQKALNLAYGQKTLPLYMHPVSSPVGRALDAYEAAKFIQRDPTNPLSYTGVPGTLWGVTKSALPAVATGAYVARDEAKTPESVQNSPQSMEDFAFGAAPEVISHPKSEKLPLRDEEALHFDEGGAVPTDLPMMAQQDPDQNVHDALVGQRANEEQSLREAAQQPMNPGLKTAVDFATYSMATPDTAPQRIAKTAVETPDIAKNFAQSQYQGVKNAGQYFADTMSGRKPMDITSPEAIQSANTIAGLVGTGGMTAGEAPAGSLGMFVGRNAQFRPAEQAMFDEGERRLLAGHDPREVHAATNVHQIHGGEPAFEISDLAARFHPDKFTVESRPFYDTGSEVYRDVPSYANLSDVLPHPELYEKYPHLKELLVSVNHEDPMYAGFVSERHGSPGYISLGSSLLSDPKKARDVLLHEIQHGIQMHEDWPLGGDPESPMLLNVPRGTSSRERMENRLNDNYYSPREAYGLTAGERQAYNVEARSDLPPSAFTSEENRRQIYPLDTEPNIFTDNIKPHPNEILIRRMGEHKYLPLDSYLRNKPRYTQGGAVDDALRLAKSKKNKVY